MPWSETSPMDQKTQFIADYLRRSLSISELCTNYGISRKNGYKWIDRYLHDGPQGLEDRSTKPYTAPNRTSEHMVRALIDLRSHHPTWGAGKLLAVIERRHRGWELPARSTACEILKRHGLVMQTPASQYTASTRAMPERLPPLEYPDRFEVRYVSANGGIRWNRQWVNVSVTCVGEYVGLEAIDDGIWNVNFGPLKLGRLLERHMRIEDAYGRLKRHHL